jgi:hypothetical protein
MERSESYYKEQIEDFIDFNYQLKKHGENLMKETKSAERYSKYFSTGGLKEEIESSVFQNQLFQNKIPRKSGIPEREPRELIDYSFNVKIDKLSYSNSGIIIRFFLDYTSILYSTAWETELPGETGKANPFIAIFDNEGNLTEYYEEPPPSSDEYISSESEELMKKMLECKTEEEINEALRLYRQKMDEKLLKNREGKKKIDDESKSIENKAAWSWNGAAAAAYAEKWAESFNPAVRRYESDCTNFVSQALEVGGKKYRGRHPRNDRKDYRYWWYDRGGAIFTSYTWAAAHNFWLHIAAFTNSVLIANSKLDEIPDRWHLLRIGDVVFHSRSNDHPKIQHTMIAHKIIDKTIFLAMHNPYIKNYDLLDHIENDKRNRAWLGYLVGNQYIGHD